MKLNFLEKAGDLDSRNAFARKRKISALVDLRRGSHGRLQRGGGLGRRGRYLKD